MVKRQKGYMYTLEVLIALSIVSVAIVMLFRMPTEKPTTELGIIRQQGSDALLALSSELRRIVFQGNETQIESLLSGALLRSISFETSICNASENCTLYNVPANQTIIVISHYVSGYLDKFSPKVLKLYLWRRY